MPTKAFPYRTVAISPVIARRASVAAAEADLTLKEFVERSLEKALERHGERGRAILSAWLRPPKVVISKREYEAISREVSRSVMRGRSI